MSCDRKTTKPVLADSYCCLYIAGKFEEGLALHFVASMFSGLVTTIASMPVDIVKTRIQNMKVVDGKPEYRGAFVSLSMLDRTLLLASSM